MSNDLIPLDSDAIRELAKTTGTALELAGKAGNYIAWVLGTVPRDLLGVLGGDWLGQVRIRNFARLNDRTEEICGCAGYQRRTLSAHLSRFRYSGRRRTKAGSKFKNYGRDSLRRRWTRTGRIGSDDRSLRPLRS